jgi:hypothetical protein
MTRLRLSPKKAARDFSAGTFEFCWIRSRYSSRCKTKSCGGFSLATARIGLDPLDFSETIRPQMNKQGREQTARFS